MCVQLSRSIYTVYLDTGTTCIILAVDQIVFKIRLYNEYGLKVHSLRFNLRVFSSQLKERFRNYSSLNVPPPFFKGP